MDFIDPLGLLNSLDPIGTTTSPTTTEENGGVDSKSHMTNPRIKAMNGGAHSPSSISASSASSFSVPNGSRLSRDGPLDLIEDVFGFYDGSLCDLTPQVEDNSKILYDCSILGLPEAGARSRTETQVKMMLRVVPNSGQAPFIKWLHLPAHQLSNRQSLRSDPHGEDQVEPRLFEDDSLTVRARILRSDIDETLHACFSCILRERRRGLKKRLKSEEDISDRGHLNETLSTLCGEQEPAGADELSKETDIDMERIIVFASSSSRVQLLRGDCSLPIRITCYCRHHDEKLGFRVKLEFLNDHHKLVGVAISPPILITDDHKKASRQSCQVASDEALSLNIPLCPIVKSTKPKVLKVVPAEGPMHGGIEITILGENLQAHELVLFGALSAPIVNYISSCTVVVRLPPSQVAGLVPISIAGQDFSKISPNEVTFFNYKNDLDRAMMELALQLIGMKMTGRVDDARDIALRIINEFSPSPTPGQNSNPANDCYSGAQRSINEPADRLERVLITCFAAAEVTGGFCFTEREVASVRTCGGQTLLHLAALARHDHLFEYLGGVGNGLLLTTVDKNGFTPADLSYFAGRDDFLEGLGLDDNETDNRYYNLDPASRYQFIQERAIGRTCGLSNSIWSALTDNISRIRRKPSRMRNHFNRLRHSVWRKVSSDASIKKYYLSTFGLDNFTIDAGTRLYQDYQDSKPLRACSRDLLFLYFWIPVVLATLMVWYFDLGADIMSVVASSWQDPAITA